jgi:RHS repeat-associated protein
VFPYSTDTSNYYQYFLADHLGNTRVSFDTPHDTLKVEQQDDYLPFGMEIAQGSIANPKNEYLYNRKELQESTGLYDYEARFYDPVVGRFTTLDPLAEIGRRWSPYSYVENNPIRFIDPDGMNVVYNPDGSVTYNNEGGSDDATNYATGLKIAGETTKEGKDKVRKEAVAAADKKKKEVENKKGQERVKPSNWQYNVPIWGDDLRAEDDWDAGNYWSWAGDQASAVTTGIFVLEAGLENTAVSGYESIAGLFEKDAVVEGIAGKSNQEWGRLFQWGKNPEGTLSKLQNVSEADIERLKDAGVSVKDVKAWRELYRNAINKVAGQSNRTAFYRMNLMNKIIELWSKK